MTRLSTLLDSIDSGTMLLPEFQRGYVWNRDQVRGLLKSLYKDYPVGGLLIWETEGATGAVRGAAGEVSGVKQLLLDGQQRITTLYGVARGRPPAFFDGDSSRFTGLHFHIEDEAFEFYASAKMRNDPLWTDVTRLLVDGLEPAIKPLYRGDAQAAERHMTRLLRLHNVMSREFNIDKVTGADKTIDDVVDIFNRVNSGGTKLSKGDLALAKVCADWPAARSEMREALNQWSAAGYNFSLDWLLRNATAIATGRSQFASLDDVGVDAFRAALKEAVSAIGSFLDLVSGRLGLDHNRVLMGRYAIPVISRHLHLNRGRFRNAAEQDKALYWYVQSALRGRFTGSTETALAQDYETVARDGIDGLVASLERWRGGNLRVDATDFAAYGEGSRFYPLLYLLTRVGEARDFGTGLPLRSQMLGHLATLQVHHIFPKALLYPAGYSRGEVNGIANFCFLTQNTNLQIGKREPREYFAETDEKHPGALASQWVPQDRSLWTVDRYRDFLSARRQLLAGAANRFLDDLRSGNAARQPHPLERVTISSPNDVDASERSITALVRRLIEMEFDQPQLDAEIADPADGRVLCIAEAYWPFGLQHGLGEPVVLELDSSEVADIARLEEMGYRVFTSVGALERYAEQRNRVSAGEQSDEYADAQA